MKKFIALTILFAVCLTFVYGCTNSTTPTAVAKKIDISLNTLYTAVTNLDTIDNSYIANPDIYNLENVASTSSIKKSIAQPLEQHAKEINVDDVSITTVNEEDVKKDVYSIEKEIIDSKIENENINDEENMDNKENNFDIQSTTESKLNDQQNNTDKHLNETDTKIEKTNVDVVFEEDVNSNTNLNDVLIIDENGEGTLIDENGKIVEDQDNIPQEKLDQIFQDTVNDETMSEENKEKVYVFLFDKIRYVPRYATNYNTEIAQTTLNNYLYKVQELYTMTADVVEANNILSEEKAELLNCIENLKTINNKMINGEITPNNQQLIALNNYVQDIKTTIKRIKSCNGQLNNEINNISTTSSNYGLSKGVDIINSNYIKILNHIDARITYFKSAVATLDQIHYILNEAQLELTYNFNEEENSTKNIEQQSTHKTSNIDTYKQTEIDVENDNNLNDSKNNQNTDSFNNNLQNDVLNTNDNVYGNNSYINDNNCNDNLCYQNNNVINNVPNNYANNYNLPIYGDDVNAPNGTFQNGIITQNNLNNGVNSGVNGNLTGYNSSNGTVDYFKQNNYQRTDKNVNTYGQNSLVDMINNGTVNNGINTLNVADTETNGKPIMVDSHENKIDNESIILNNTDDENEVNKNENLNNNSIENIEEDKLENNENYDSEIIENTSINVNENLKNDEDENSNIINDNNFENDVNDDASNNTSLTSSSDDALNDNIKTIKNNDVDTTNLEESA